MVLCLMLIKGPEVQSWVNRETDKIEAELLMGVDPTNDKLWNNFQVEFEQTFIKKPRATIAGTMPLQQEGMNLEDYIVRFNKLATQYQWQNHDKGTMHRFRVGLNKTLKWSLY